MELRWYESMVTASTDPMMFVDSNYTHRAANPAYCDEHRRTREEILGHTIAEAFGEKYFENTLRPNLDRCLSGRRVNFEYWWDSPRRGRRHVDARYDPFIEGDGSVSGVLVEMRDTTDQWLSKQELERSVVSLDVLNQELEMLSVALAHDLKEPLLTLTNLGYYLRESLGDSLEEEPAKHLRRIRAAGHHMKHVIEDLGRHAEANRRDLVREEIDLSSLGRAIMDDLFARAPDRYVSFEAEAGITAVGDKALVRILLTNLLQNAWKYTRPSDDAQIKLGVSETEDGVPSYYVRDNGIGFDNADVEKIFQASARLHTTAEFTGTGIGLTTVERIVVRHGGRVWAEGIPGEGAVFHFSLGSVWPNDRRVMGPRANA